MDFLGFSIGGMVKRINLNKSKVMTDKQNELVQVITKAVFVDKVRLLTEVSLKYNGYPYCIGGITKQDIKVAVSSIKGIDYYVNSYGVLCLRF